MVGPVETSGSNCKATRHQEVGRWWEVGEVERKTQKISSQDEIAN